MSTRSERDKQKSTNDKHIAILTGLLKEEDNKYCVDCDAKGPRWASWNLGIFLCIRCAGIHRNLGVHISKVKSVNLDTWTPEQISMMQEMGNSRARAVYEAYLPDNFRRPQTDSSLEAFIRSKYETKKYIAKEWIPPVFKSLPQVVEEKKEKKKPKPKANSNLNLTASKASSSSPVNSHREERERPRRSPQTKKKQPEPAVDLLGLDTQPTNSSNAANSDDLFTDFLGANTAPVTTNNDISAQPAAKEAQKEIVQEGQGEASLFGETGSGGGGQKSTKESILALYGSSSNQQNQMFTAPGAMYMPPQQMNMGQMGVVGMPQQNMMGQQQVGMNMGMQPQMMNMQGVQQQGQMRAPQPQQQQQQAQMGQMQGYPGMMNPGMGMQNQYNMGNMYNIPQQQQQQQQQVPQQMTQQMQAQFAGMQLAGQSNNMMGFNQQAPVPVDGGWGTQKSGQTLSTNLWQ